MIVWYPHPIDNNYANQQNKLLTHICMHHQDSTSYTYIYWMATNRTNLYVILIEWQTYYNKVIKGIEFMRISVIKFSRYSLVQARITYLTPTDFVVKHVLLLCQFVRFCAGKTALVLKRSCNFSSAKWNKLTEQQDIILLSIRATTSWKCWWIRNSRHKLLPEIVPEINVAMC